ncbi:MAG: murein biosynthesis integral membrane protein MurJ [Patescibacteria group bacterium]
MFSTLFSFQNKSISSAALFLAGAALLSRLLGLFRDRLLAGTFGAGEELDAYFAAFRVPDFLFSLFVLGGISAVFLPLFSAEREKGEKEAWRFVNNLLHALILAIALLAGALAIFAPQLMGLVAPGFSPEQKELAANLTRLMLLSPVLFGISAVFTGVLHYFNRFLAYAMAPVLYNLGIIFGLLFLAPILGIWGAALGVLGGAALHALIQIPAAVRSGFIWRPVLDWRDIAIRRALKLALPRTLGGAAYQVNLIIMTALASTLTSGSIAVFMLADNLQSAPVGLVGIPLALASFPVLSRSFAKGEKGEFRKALLSALRKIIWLVLPASVLLCLLREPIVRILYHTGAFEAGDAQLASMVLGMFTLGILFQALIPLLSRAFFALQDTKTPTLIGVGAVAANVSLALLFLNLLPTWEIEPLLALPLALVASGFLQCVFLAFFLRKKMMGSFPQI